MLATAGCTKRYVAVEPVYLPNLASEYQARGVASVPNDTGVGHIVVRREHEPELSVNGPLRGPEVEKRPWECVGTLSAPLQNVHGEKDAVVVHGCRLGVTEIESATLTVDSSAPVTVTPDEAKSLVTPDLDELRHRLGVQLGGSAYFQISYRYRIVGPLFLDVGALAITHGVNGSTGFVVQAPVSDRWSLYVGSAAGFGAGFGPSPHPDCDPAATTECPLVTGSTTTAFVSGRAGAAYAVGSSRRHIFGLDGGVWYGVLTDDDGAGGVSSRRFLWPMAGLSYHYAL